MKKNKILMMAAAAALTLGLFGCSAKQETAPTGEKVPLATVADKAVAPEDDGTEAPIELLALDNVIDFSYSNYDTDMIFQKDSGVWYDSFDKGIPINQEKFEKMAQNFLHLNAISKLDGGSMDEFGMKYPPYSLNVTDGEKGEFNIYIGNQSEDGNYPLTIDEETFYAVKKSAVEALIFDYDEMVVRDTLDLNVTAGDLEKVTITSGGKTTSYKSSDKDAMERIAAGISALKPNDYASFNATESELASSELDEKVKTTFAAQLKSGGKTQVLTVDIGTYVDPEGLRRYARLDGSQMICLVESTVINDLLNAQAEQETDQDVGQTEKQ